MGESPRPRSNARPRATPTGLVIAAVVAGLGALGCKSAPTSTPPPPTAPTPAPPTPEPIADAPTPAPPPKVPVDFDPSAVLFGSCGAFGSDLQDYEGPFVVGFEVLGWTEGEPLWVMTNAGGVVESVAGRRVDACGDEPEPPRPPKRDKGGIKTGGDGESGDDESGDDESDDDESDDDDGVCVPARAIEAAALRCDPVLRSDLPAKLTYGDHDRELGLLFALPRHVRPPEVLQIRYKLRSQGRCLRPETSASFVPLTAAPAAMDRRFHRVVPKTKGLAWRAVEVSYAASERPAHHVYYSADPQRGRRIADWDVFVDGSGGSETSLVREADRHEFDSGFVRDRNCGVPYSNPWPTLAFVHAGRLHWITTRVATKVEAQIWRFDDDALAPVRTIPGSFDSHYF